MKSTQFYLHSCVFEYVPKTKRKVVLAETSKRLISPKSDNLGRLKGEIVTWRFPFWLKDFPHTSQENGLAPECHRRCSFRLVRWEKINSFSEIDASKGYPFIYLVLWANDCLQMVQLWIFTGLWIGKWFNKFGFVLNDAPHVVHEYGPV